MELKKWQEVEHANIVGRCHSYVEALRQELLHQIQQNHKVRRE